MVLEIGMHVVKHRSVRSLIVAASAFASAAGLAPLASAGAWEPPATSATIDALDRAAVLRSEGRLVQARETIMAVVGRDAGRSLSDPERSRAFEMLAGLNQAISSLTPAALALQKAEAALAADDFAAAERSAGSIANLPGATDSQIESALEILEVVRSKRERVADRVPTAMTEIEQAMSIGDYARAKSLIGSVLRSGVVLSPADTAALDRAQAVVIEHEDASGKLIDAEVVSLGMLQPGVVKRRDDIPPPVNGYGTPAPAQPGSQPPASVPPAAEPAPAAPAPAPAPAAAPAAPPPSSTDLITQARMFEAQSMLAEADLAFTERRLNEAANKYARLQGEYRDLLSLDQSRHVDGRLTETRLLLRGNVGPEQDLIQSALETNRFAKQATLAEFNNLMSQSSASLQTQSVSEARLQALKAQLTLKSARQYFAESEYEGLMAQTTSLLDKIGKTEDQLRLDDIRRREADLKRQADDQARARTLDRDRKIGEHIDRVRALQMEMKYKEALQVVDQILFLDPISPSGLLLKDVLTALMIYQEFNELESRAELTHALMRLGNKEAALIPGASVVNYPSDWPSISFRRGEMQAFREPPENQSVLAKLDQPVQQARFADATIEQVVQFVEAISQLNIDVDWASLEEIGVDRSTPVSLNLSRVPIRTVLDRVLDKVSPDRLSRAAWAVNDGILQIASDEALRKNTILAIYDIRDLLIEVPDFDNAPEFDLSQVLQSNQGGGGRGGQSPFQNTNDDNNDTRLPLEERRQQIIDIITQNIDFEGWTDNGGDTGRIQPLAGSLIITNTARNHREIGGLLSKLREQRALQINVETRFLLVSSGFFEQIGFDLDVYFNANNNQVRTAQAGDRTIQTSDFFNFGQGGLQRSVTGAAQPTAPGTGNTGQLTQGVVNPRSWSPIGAGQNSLGLAGGLLSGALPEGSVGSAVIGAAPALGIAGQFLDDVQVDFLVTATQADRRSVQLTAPRLTFMNGQRANISVATQVAFISDLTPVTSDSAVGFDPTVGAVSEGVLLDVDGTVSADRRYVTLNVRTNLARIDGFAERAVTAVAGGQLVSSSSVESFVQLPTITATTVNTTVSVPDQGTILLGGQRLLTEVEVETGVPVLSKIPIISRFFTNRIETTEEQTLLILLKPTILIQNEEEDRNFPGLGDATRAGLAG